MAKRNKRGHIDWPTPSDPCLRAALEALRRRRKALRYQGVEFRLWGNDDRYEWIEASWGGYGVEPIEVVVQLVAQNTLHIYVISCAAWRRGKILLRAEDLWLVANGPAIVEAIEQSLFATRGVRSIARLTAAVRRIWEPVTLVTV